ncbi:Flp1 family type IVb pilin [Paenibacillus lautus]|uniref:Flp1 family type IVb pilin n=1 Tax=Paenibacillus lautus TaxID=1401 RepID=UPI000FD70B11|nr:Flp1 family type IVb pilin [Paenibacillus lautus]
MMLNMAKNGMKAFWEDEKGIGTLEMILILVVILIIALIFKDQITALVNNLFKNVNNKSKEFLE